MIEKIMKRQSVRTYSHEAIPEQIYRKIEEYINNPHHFTGPFGNKSRVELVKVTQNVTDKGIKLGTYGFIKNPRAYLVGISENDRISLLDFAYCFQRLVLTSTGLGLGTCWMGGTFNRNSFEKEISMDTEDFIPAISPIGFPNDKQRLFDKAVRAVVKADNKKPWDKLFYDSSFAEALDKETAGPFAVPIEMVRLGPSASNKQPWRLVLAPDRKACHLFIEHTPNYSSKLGYDMQLLDMGIAMCQFDLACKELKIDGGWAMADPGLAHPNENIEYIASWKTS